MAEQVFQQILQQCLYGGDLCGQPHGFWVLEDGWKDPGCADRVALTESWSSHLTASAYGEGSADLMGGSASQAGGYPVDHVTVYACKTRGRRVFRVVVAGGGTGARRTCVACGQSAYVADSGEYWMEEEAEPVSCECGGSTFEFVVSFSLHPGGDAVRMICVGLCCLGDGMLGSSAGWDIRDHPGLHLLGQA